MKRRICLVLDVVLVAEKLQFLLEKKDTSPPTTRAVACAKMGSMLTYDSAINTSQSDAAEPAATKLYLESRENITL